MTWTVVKVGGSLYDWPELGERLRAWLAQLDAERVLIVPGGGATADAIRLLDRMHGLGEETSHWLAIRALSLNARFLQRLLPDCDLMSDLHRIAPASQRLNVVDAFAVFAADETHPDHLPHDWRVTSDSLAVRCAVLVQARELILLKSLDWPGNDWTQATQAGIVDPYFADALHLAPATLRTRIVNLREKGVRTLFASVGRIKKGS
jgi:5-(aminomethyl)-3-furanmethanol phosphate kinase